VFCVCQARSAQLDERFAEFEAAQQEISRWMDAAETELCDIIKPTITDRVAVIDNSAPRIQVRRKTYDLLKVFTFSYIDKFLDTYVGCNNRSCAVFRLEVIKSSETWL